MSALSIITKIKDITRLRQIFSVLAKYGYGEIIEKAGLGDSRILGMILPKPSNSTASGPERLRRALEELGPSFIKLGQILSTRADLITPTYAEEFSKLQDNVPPFSSDEVKNQMRSELGREIEDLFTSFDYKPVASASLSQVHRACTDEGLEVAVKIQRPGIRPLIESDIDLLYILAELAQRSIPELKLYTPKKIVREFERAIMKELDFTIEAANAERFRMNFSGDPDVFFPKVYDGLSGKRILTMDFIEGVKITDASICGYDPKLIARLGLRAVVEMIFRDGFFHADPHPANVFIIEQSRLAYLDLGLAGRVSTDMREKMLLLLLAVIREDFEEVVEILYRIGIKEGDVDISEFRGDVIDICEKHFGKQLKYMELGAFLKDIIEGTFRHKIRIPPEYALMCKALVTMEGVGKQLDPDINIFKESHPYLVDILKQRYSPGRISRDIAKAAITLSSALRETPLHIKGILESLESGRFKVRVEDMGEERLASVWEKLINRIILALITIVLTLMSFILIFFGASPWTTLLGALGFLFAGALGFWLLFSIIKSGKF